MTERRSSLRLIPCHRSARPHEDTPRVERSEHNPEAMETFARALAILREWAEAVERETTATRRDRTVVSV